MSDWIDVLDPAALEAALKLARGSYQRDLLRGRENLSGSTLKGKASRSGAHYKRSRDALLDRMTKAGIIWSRQTRAHGRIVLVVGVTQPPTWHERILSDD